MTYVNRLLTDALIDLEQGKLESALRDVCTAIDATSQAEAGVNDSSNKLYKNFIASNLWLITYVGTPGIVVFDDLLLPCSHRKIKLNSNGHCSLKEIIYGVIRCELAHGKDLLPTIKWSDNAIGGHDSRNGKLELPNTLVWGLIAAVVCSPSNIGCKVGESYCLQVGLSKIPIDWLWGRVNTIKEMLRSEMILSKKRNNLTIPSL